MSAPHPLIQKITERRDALGLTGVDIHALTGIARSTVRNWETGRRDPQLGALDAYLRALGLRLTIEPLNEPTTVLAGDQLPYGQLVIGEGEKWCSGCLQARSRACDFFTDRSRKDGVQSRCKYCVNDRDARREARLERLATEGAA